MIKKVGHGKDRRIFKRQNGCPSQFELSRNFLCLIFQGKSFCVNIQLALSIVLTQGDRARLFGSRKWSAYQPFLDLQSSVMKKQVPPFLWSVSIFLYQKCLKNSFLAHYYHINLENSPQLNFRTMKRCHFLMDSVHFKNFWTLSADHFPLPAVFFHC